MFMINKIKSALSYLTKPMPLSDFTDYDNYWERRDKEHNPSPISRGIGVSNYIQPNSTILDVGCGDGMVINYLQEHNSPKRLVGVDISHKMISVLRSKGFKVYQLDITSSSFAEFLKNQRFDYIIITEVLEHIQESEKVMLTVKNHFDKSLIVSVPNAGYYLNRIRFLFGKFPNVAIIYHIKEHIRFWTHGDFLYWCNYLGFKVVRFNNYIYAPSFMRHFGKYSVPLFGIQPIYELKVKK